MHICDETKLCLVGILSVRLLPEMMNYYYAEHVFQQNSLLLFTFFNISIPIKVNFLQNPFICI